MSKGRITIYDIAKEADVSVSTVSRVLTGNARVKDDKRIKIEEIIKKYDYRPNEIARILSKKESKTIGVILPEIINPFFSSVFMEVERVCLEAGYAMMLCSTLNRVENELFHLSKLSEKQVDAIIFMGGSANDREVSTETIRHMNQILETTPIILINGRIEGVDCHRIIVKEDEGINNLVDYLAALGHKKIGMLGGIKGVTSTDIKHESFISALQRNGLAINNDWVITWSFGVESGYETMKMLLQLEEKPTAVIAINDFVAAGAIKAAKYAGLRVPEDISIAGFDGSYIANLVEPSLTTVSQNYEEIGKVVVDTILQIMNNKFTEKEKTIDTMLLIGDSCLNIL